MATVTIRDAAAEDFAAICALNLADVQHTSAMDLKRLAELHGLSCHHRVGCVDGAVAAFLLAMSRPHVAEWASDRCCTKTCFGVPGRRDTRW